MSRFSGQMYKGAQRERKIQRREEAEERNARTKPERRRAYRREALPVIEAMERKLKPMPDGEIDAMVPTDSAEYRGGKHE